MANIGLTIKVWLKLIVFAAISMYGLFFLINNISHPAISVWLWFGHTWETGLIPLLFVTVLMSVVGTLLAGPVVRMFRQLLELQRRRRESTRQREVDAMLAKSSMLQTRDSVAAASVRQPPGPTE